MIQNGKITNDVSMDDLRRMFGVASWDLTTIISHANINKWAVWKPIASDSKTPICLSDVIRYYNYGLDVMSLNATFGQCVEAVTKELLDDAGKYYPDGVKYKPLTAPYRMSDFLNPNDRTLGYNPIVELKYIVADSSQHSSKIDRATMVDGEDVDFSHEWSARQITNDKQAWADYLQVLPDGFNKDAVDVFSLLYYSPNVANSVIASGNRCVLMIDGADYKFFFNSVTADDWMKGIASASGEPIQFVEMYTDASTVDNGTHIFVPIPGFMGTIKAYIAANVRFGAFGRSKSSAVPDGTTVNIWFTIERKPIDIWGADVKVKLVLTKVNEGMWAESIADPTQTWQEFDYEIANSQLNANYTLSLLYDDSSGWKVYSESEVFYIEQCN